LTTQDRPFGGGQEEIRVRLGVADLVAGYNGDSGRDAQGIQRRTGTFEPAAGGDGPGDTGLGQGSQQLAGAWQRTDRTGQAGIRFRVQPEQPGRFIGSQGVAGLAQNSVDHKSAAHADAPVDSPHGQVDADRRHRFVPGEHVLVDAVHQRAVQVEQEGGSAWFQVESRRCDGLGDGGDPLGREKRMAKKCWAKTLGWRALSTTSSGRTHKFCLPTFLPTIFLPVDFRLRVYTASS
jgi:hypothetical protein